MSCVLWTEHATLCALRYARNFALARDNGVRKMLVGKLVEKGCLPWKRFLLV